jgi:predicted lipoprotein with Yx(FWY)xxD motif
MRHRAAALLVMAALTACETGSGDPPDAAQAATPTSPVTEATTPTSSSPPQTSFEEVEVALSAGPDPHLVDPEGRSLYLFTLDEERTSTCEGPCAETWPPFLGRPVAGEGVDPGLAGNAERSDGSIQVTYAGHPLYRHTGDVSPGDIEGHGFNDVWFLVAPDGDALSR